MNVVRVAIKSLMAKLGESDSVLDADTLNLFGNEGYQYFNIARDRLRDIGNAFTDLLEGRISDTARSTEVMPGSKPYNRKDATEQSDPPKSPVGRKFES
jgi:hypothetical protein